MMEDYFKKHNDIYKLVLTDLSMPILDGFEVMNQICRFCDDKQIPKPLIVAVTGHSETEFFVKAKECGADEVLSKPPNKKKLRTLL